MSLAAAPARALRAPVGVLLMTLALGYAALLHHGVGPAAGPGAAWWQPRGFLLESSALAPLFESSLQGLAALLAPAVALCAAVFLTTRSAVVRTLTLTAVLASALFLFYGLRSPGPQVWRFFGWRGSAVMACSALAVAAAALAPWLAASWQRRGWPVRLVLYAPIFLAVLCVERNLTGTDPQLRFAISPWPALPVFGLETAGSVLAAVVAFGALASASLALWTTRPATSVLGVSLALALPGLRVALGLGPGANLVALALGVAVAVLALMQMTPQRPRGGFLWHFARHSAIGAVLAALPILCGMWLAEHDYRLTRDHSAQRIIDALAAYYERQQEYPETLEDLVAAHDLPEVPETAIGFALLGEPAFSYQNFGASYILEFAAPRWVQCAYNPPWSEDEGDAVQADMALVGAEDGGGPLPGAWSCPSKPPELW